MACAWIVVCMHGCDWRSFVMKWCRLRGLVKRGVSLQARNGHCLLVEWICKSREVPTWGHILGICYCMPTRLSQEIFQHRYQSMGIVKCQKIHVSLPATPKKSWTTMMKHQQVNSDEVELGRHISVDFICSAAFKMSSSAVQMPLLLKCCMIMNIFLIYFVLVPSFVRTHSG